MTKKIIHFTGILSLVIFAGLFYYFFLYSPATPIKSSAPSEREVWYGLYFKGHKIGYSVFEVKKAQDGFIFVDKMFMKVSMLGKKIDALSYAQANMDSNGVLEKFEFTLQSSDTEFHIKGKREGNELKLQMMTPAGKSETTIPFDKNLFLPMTIGTSIKKLKKTKQMKVPFFDPSTLARDNLNLRLKGMKEIKVLGSKRKVYVVEQEFQGIKTISYIDENGVPLMEESSIGLKSIAESPEKAMKEGWEEEVDIIDLSAVPLVNNTGVSLKEARTALIRIYNWEGEPPPGFVSKNGYYEIFVKRVNLDEVEKLKGRIGKGMYLEDEPLLEVSSEKIKEKAREIVGNEKNVLKKAKLIFRWVYHNIKKVPSFTVPSALEVLKSMRGDCNEHTVLYTALARAAGIPARIAVGLVQQGDYLYYHAWSEIFYKEWIPVDPTLGQFPADLSHIKLGEGNISKWIEALRGLGKMKVEVVKAER